MAVLLSWLPQHALSISIFILKEQLQTDGFKITFRSNLCLNIIPCIFKLCILSNDMLKSLI